MKVNTDELNRALDNLDAVNRAFDTQKVPLVLSIAADGQVVDPRAMSALQEQIGKEMPRMTVKAIHAAQDRVTTKARELIASIEACLKTNAMRD